MTMANERVFMGIRLFGNRYITRVFQNIVSREKLASVAFGVSGKQKASQLADSLQSKVQSAWALFVRQCNGIAGQRAWRGFQILSWYRQLYGEKHLLQTLRTNFYRHCRDKNKQLCMLLSAAGIFQWERDGISDKEINSALSEMKAVEDLVDHSSRSPNKHVATPDGWEIVIDKEHLKVWRRFLNEFSLYEYKVYGTFTDITPQAFYNTQMDLRFWSGWDQQAMAIDVVDVDVKSNSSIIHWVYKFPYPMYPRDYCYVRRSMVDESENKMVILAKAVLHHKCPEVNNYVRVKQYQSQMVIEPHTSLDENGFNYYMDYFDDPQTQLPSVCYNWLASTGVPDFVERLHSAAKVMQERTQHGYQPNVQAPSQTSENHGDSKDLPKMQQYC